MKEKVRTPFIPNVPHDSKKHNQGFIDTYTINLLITHHKRRGSVETIYRFFHNPFLYFRKHHLCALKQQIIGPFHEAFH